LLSDPQAQKQASLDKNTDRHVLLLKIARRIAAGGSLSAMLPDVTQATLLGAHADGLRIALNTMPLAFASGEASAKMVKHDAIITARVADGSTLSTTALEGDLAPLSESFKGVIGFSLAAHGTNYGVMWAGYTAEFNADDEMFLAIVSAQAAVAIANAIAFDVVRQNREQLATILSSSADPILVIDQDSRVMLLNPAAERVFNVVASAVRGKPVSEVVGTDVLLQLLSGEVENSSTIEWQDSSNKAFAPRVSDVCEEDGSRIGRVLVLRDITHYKNLRENQAEFVSTVSHDLRSPLTYMQGYATMLPMVGELNEKQQGFADKIITGIAQMSDLVEKILDASRLDPEGNYQLKREPVDVVKMIYDVQGFHAPPAEKKGLALNVDIQPGLPILLLDEMMLKRALNNLVDNAVKYTPTGGAITIRAKTDKNMLIIDVQDTGLGISEENQKHLFERFRRVRRREHQTVKGSGLGLFIVKNVAQRHGGDTILTSREGEGSTFSIMIPMEGANLLTVERKA
jgi:PAS domain S-box-containing protein